MKCIGNFKFKGIEKKPGGKFINDKGKEIIYNDSYRIKVDEVTEYGIYERDFKIPANSDLAEPLLITKPYTDIELEFDIRFYGNRISCIPVAIVK